MLGVTKMIWRIWRLGLMTPILVGVLGWQCWMAVRPEPLPLDTQRVALADEVAGKLAESLPEPPVGRPVLMVAPFERDPTGMLTDAVRRAVDRVDRYTVQPTTVVENTLEKLGIDRKPLSPKDAASYAMEDIEGEYLLAGRVEALSARSDMDEAALEGVLVPVGAAQGAVPLSAQVVHDHSATRRRATMQAYPWPARLVGWLASVLLFPLFAAPLVSRGLERESNVVNLALLLGLTLAAGLAAYAMLDFRLDTGLGALLLIAGSGLALYYNWFVLSKMEELRCQ